MRPSNFTPEFATVETFAYLCHMMKIKDYIQPFVIAPLEEALDMRQPSIRLSSYGLDRHLYDASVPEDKDNNVESILSTLHRHHPDELYDAMSPLCVEFVLHPEDRMMPIPYWHKLNEPKDERLWRMEASRIISNYCYRSMPHKSNLVSECGLFGLTESLVRQANSGYSKVCYYQDHVLGIIRDGYDEDWDALYQKVRPELVHGPKDYNRIRVECFAYLMCVVMIFRNGTLDRKQKEDMLSLLLEDSEWSVFKQLFSVFTGLIIGSKQKNILSVINTFSDSYKPYAHLLQSALQYKPEVLQTDNPEKEAQYKKARERLEKALTSEEANHELDELFHTIFPRVEMELYAQPTQRMTAAETRKRLTDQQHTIEELTHTIDAQQVELSELRPLRQLADDITRKYNEDSITFDELAQAILSIANAEKAQQIYFYLNNRLRKNAAWLRGRDWLEDQIDARVNGESVQAQTERMEAAVNSRPNVIGQLNMGDGTQQLPDNLKRLENLKTDE